MSTRRENDPAIPDRLPGEGDIARLYQQAETGPDEQPSAALDAAILAEARRTVHPRLHLIKGGRFGQMTRRWALPLSVAAMLMITIGVVSNLKEDIGRPLMRVQSEEAPAVASDRDVQSRRAKRQDGPKEAQKNVAKKSKTARKLASSLPADDAFDLKDEAAQLQQKMDAPSRPMSAPKQDPRPTVQAAAPTAQAPAPREPEFREVAKEQGVFKPEKKKRRRNERDAALLEKSEEEMDTASLAPAPSLEASLQEEAQSLSHDARVGQRIGRTDLRYEIVPRAPKDWLADIGLLFKAGKRREAEDSLQEFQKQYPDYADYPDTFPAEVLEWLKRR